MTSSYEVPDSPESLEQDPFDGTESFLLSEHLPLYPHNKILYRVTVTPAYITWVPNSSHPKPSVKNRKSSLKGKRSSSKLSVSSDSTTSEVRQSVITKGGLFLHFEDVVGCDCMKGKAAKDPNAYITIYAYPHKKKVTSKKTIRKRETLTLAFSKAETYEDNFKEAEVWRKVIQCLVKRVQFRDIEDFNQLEVPVLKKLLVFLNPFSGPGKAVNLFKHRIVPVLAEASMLYEAKITEYAGQAQEMMQNLNLEQWYGILIVSGDGLVFEVINGLMSRPDWEQAIKQPIGCVPGGSGNALCCSISHHAEEPYLNNHVIHASFGISKHILSPMDLVAVETLSGKVVYSCLSCCWGLMSDVDIESEKYRSIGNARFTLGGAIRILNLRKNKGKVSFLPIGDYTPPPPTRRALTRTQSEAPGGSTDQSFDSTLPVRAQSMIEGSESASSSFPTIQRSQSVDNDIDEETDNDDKINGTGIEGLEKVSNEKATSNGVTMRDCRPPCGPTGTEARPGPKLKYPPLEENIPADWITCEGEFVNVAAVYLSHLNKDMIPVPDGHLNDEVIHLIIIKAGISRMKLLNLMGNMEKGQSMHDPHLELIKVKAFRIEPYEKDGIMTVDGERIEFGPVQGELLPSMANIMVPNKGIFKSN